MNIVIYGICAAYLLVVFVAVGDRIQREREHKRRVRGQRPRTAYGLVDAVLRPHHYLAEQEADGE
jgi:hypothetical protein